MRLFPPNVRRQAESRTLGVARMVGGAPPIAKLSAPRLANLVARERLLAPLDRPAACPIIWICGPPGAGKTALAVSYLETRGFPALWYQIDPDDSEPATLFHYLRLAAAHWDPGIAERLPPLTPEYLGDLAGFSRRFFRGLFAALPRPGLLVFDNFQEAAGPPLIGVMQQGLAQVPAGVSVLILSRTRPPDRCARLRASQCLEVIDWDRLRLTLDEALAIAERVGGLDPELIARQHERCRGWAAGFVLCLQQVQNGEGGAAWGDAAEPPPVVFDYLASEVLAALPEETRALLIRSAVPPRVSLDAARALSGNGEAGRVLDALHEERLFIDRRPGPRGVYQFHPLFREFLLSRARATLGPDELSGLTRLAARLLEQEGEIEGAAALFGESAAWDDLARLVCAQAPLLLSQGRGQVIERWIGALPPALAEGSPWLLYWRGLARLPSGPAEARDLFAGAHALFVGQHETVGRFLACAAVLDTFFWEWSDFAPADPWIRVLERLLAEHPELPSPEVEERVVSAGITVLFREPANPLLPGLAERAERLLGGAGPPHRQLGVPHFLLQYLTFHGAYAQATQALREMELALPHWAGSPLVLIGLRCFDATLQFLLCEHGLADAAVRAALAVAEEYGIHAFDSLVIGQGVYAALGAGDSRRAREGLQHLEAALVPGRRLDLGFASHLRAGAALLEGELDAARIDAESALAVAERAGSPWLQMLNRCVLAQVLIAQGEPGLARQHAAWVRDLGAAMSSPSVLHTALALEAFACLQTGGTAAALDLLRQSFALGRAHRYTSLLPSLLPPGFNALCAFALEHRVERDYVLYLIRRHGLSPPASRPESWPWPVKVYTLGGFALHLDGSPLVAHGKAQKRTLDLLRALTALGGLRVDAARLCDLLWPETDGAAARSAFDMTLHRLRRLLRRDDALSLHDGKLSLNPDLCWVDAFAVEDALRALERLQATNAPLSELGAPAERLLALYQGEFLHGESDAGWVLPPRERLRRRFVRQVVALGRRWEHAGQDAEALDLYERGLDQDPLSEELYRRLMHLHRAQGDRAAALGVYRRCQDVLLGVLGTVPSQETQELFRLICG